MKISKLLAVITLALSIPPFLAQSAPGTSASSVPAPPARYGRRSGCWEQAGISPSVAQQGREIARNMHAQVLAVCNDSSLNPQQQKKQIRLLRQQALEQLRGLVTEQQAAAYQSCIERRAASRLGGEHSAEPCASRPEGPPATSVPSGSSENQER